MNPISFISANYVARQSGYHMTEGWGAADAATQAYFRPVETYAERFSELLHDIKAMGFEAIDLWGAHLHPRWATDEHLRIAREQLQQHGLRGISLAGWWDTLEDFEASCQIAAALDVPILGGGGSLIERERAAMIDRLRAYGLKYGLENHPEKTPDEVLAKIGDDAEDVIGLAVDTGWFGTQGYDAAEAIRALYGRIFHVHLKDVLAAGAHETCRYGRGVVPVERCVRLLREMGYTGAIGIEHEPEHFDPTDDVSACYDMLRGWLA